MDQEKLETVETVTTPADDSARKKRLTRATFSAGGNDENKRRWLYLVVDILLLALIAAAIVFLVFLLTPNSPLDTPDGEMRPITYTVELAGVEKSMLGSFRVGDTVTDKESGAVLGTITAIENRPYEVYSSTATVDPDDPYLFEVPKITYPEDLKTVIVTISVTAEYIKGVGYRAEECRIAVGREYQLNFPGYTGAAVCIGFEEK